MFYFETVVLMQIYVILFNSTQKKTRIELINGLSLVIVILMITTIPSRYGTLKLKQLEIKRGKEREKINNLISSIFIYIYFFLLFTYV